MRRFTLMTACVLAMTLVAPATARAEAFVGASFLDVGVEVDEASFNFDEDDDGYKIFGGFRFGKFFAVEGAWADLGEPDTASVGAIEITGLSAFAVGRLPLGFIELFAKGGLYQWDAEFEDAMGMDAGDDDGTDFTYGAGILFKIGDHIGIRGEWEIFTADSDGADADLDIISVGAEFRF